MRKTIIAGNWKMNKDARETEEFCVELGLYLGRHNEDRVLPLIAPGFPFLTRALEILSGLPAAVAGQDVSSHAAGAYTGEVAAGQLRSLGLTHCIIGHSERRQYHGESDAEIRAKLLQLKSSGLIPIVCVGESLAQRENGETEQVVLAQMNGCFEQVDLETGREAVVAYEPVWAIGTGKTATAEQAQEVHGIIRTWLLQRYGADIAGRISILYGGSVKPGNLAELLQQPDIDGGLIGGASLQIGDFCAMLDTAVKVVRGDAEC